MRPLTVNPQPRQPCFLRLPLDCLPLVLDALNAAGRRQEALDVAQFTRQYTDPVANARRLAWTCLAYTRRGRDGDIEFDADAAVGASDGPGEYVLGWVWVEAEKDEHGHPKE